MKSFSIYNLSNNFLVRIEVRLEKEQQFLLMLSQFFILIRTDRREERLKFHSHGVHCENFTMSSDGQYLLIKSYTKSLFWDMTLKNKIYETALNIYKLSQIDSLGARFQQMVESPTHFEIVYLVPSEVSIYDLLVTKQKTFSSSQQLRQIILELIDYYILLDSHRLWVPYLDPKCVFVNL